MVAHAGAEMIFDSDDSGYWDWVEIIYEIFGTIFWLP